MRPGKVERDTPWPHGHPCWVEVRVGHPGRAAAFYGQLFGWTFFDHGPDYQHYLTARRNGRAVADIGPRPAGESTAEPSAWLVCFAVDSTDAAAKEITRAGGTLLLPPLDVGSHGRFAVAADPAGAEFAVWQANAYSGTEIAGVAGSVVRHHCLSRDVEASRAFYADVFGLTSTRSRGPDGDGHVLLLDGQPVAGISALGADAPADASSHWRVTFGVADLGSALEKVAELGGTVREGPFHTPHGRSARVTDEQGTAFEVLEVGDQG
ncbi:VOC family protein [Streptomyces sp. NPDC001135]